MCLGEHLGQILSRCLGCRRPHGFPRLLHSLAANRCWGDEPLPGMRPWATALCRLACPQAYQFSPPALYPPAPYTHPRTSHPTPTPPAPNSFDMMENVPLELDLATPDAIVVGDYIKILTPVDLPDNRPEDRLTVNCAEAANTASELCIPATLAGEAVAASPAPAPPGSAAAAAVRPVAFGALVAALMVALWA